MQSGEKEPRDGDDVCKLWENAEAVFCGERTDGVTYVLSKLGDHDGERARGRTEDLTRLARCILPHVIYTVQGKQSLQGPDFVPHGGVTSNTYICGDAHWLARRR